MSEQIKPIGDPCETLEEQKIAKLTAIDRKTFMIIGTGFMFNSKRFSLSIPAQLNWTNIKSNKADFTFPLKISTFDDGEYELVETDVSNFWRIGKDFVKGILDAGRALKLQVKASTTQAELDAVVDNR